MIWLLSILACGDDDPIDEVCTPSDEVCDGVDSDCDGRVDEGVLDVVYGDGDGDGFGDPSDSEDACGTEWPGYAASGDDCNDANASQHPGAEEICDNLVDDDCDGETDEDCPVDSGDSGSGDSGSGDSGSSDSGSSDSG